MRVARAARGHGQQPHYYYPAKTLTVQDCFFGGKAGIIAGP
jgi:hypothetical protein